MNSEQDNAVLIYAVMLASSTKKHAYQDAGNTHVIRCLRFKRLSSYRVDGSLRVPEQLSSFRGLRTIRDILSKESHIRKDPGLQST
jgi:hypothetical protein